MRVLVCGGRDFDDYDTLKSVLSALQITRGSFEVIIHGGARGADSMASLYGERHLIPRQMFPADWQKHGSDAGPIRNQKMLDEGRPDLVVAFPTPKSRGTWDMVRRAKKAGVEVIEVA